MRSFAPSSCINLFFGRPVISRLALVQGPLPLALPPTEPVLRPLAPSEVKALDAQLSEIAEQKRILMDQIEKIVGSPNEREWPNEIVLEVRAGVGGEEASLFAEEPLESFSAFAWSKK